MAGQQTAYGHYRYQTRDGTYHQGDGWIINNTTSAGHTYSSGEHGDINGQLKKFTSAYGEYWSNHTLPKINAEKRNVNAWYVKRSLQAKGFSLNAICGICGNMQAESGINPGVYEGWKLRAWPSVNFGVGLTQWTPSFKLCNWAKDNGDLHIYDIETQCKYINWQADNNQQYSRTAHVPSSWGVVDVHTFREFKVSTAPPYDLGANFFWYYEKPSDSPTSAKARGNNAKYFYQLFTGEQPPGPGPGPGPEPGNIPIWLLFKIKQSNMRRR